MGDLASKQLTSDQERLCWGPKEKNPWESQDVQIAAGQKPIHL